MLPKKQHEPRQQRLHGYHKHEFLPGCLVLVALRYGLTLRLVLGLNIPYIDYSGGIFDGFIEGAHSACHKVDEPPSPVPLFFC